VEILDIDARRMAANSLRFGTLIMMSAGLRRCTSIMWRAARRSRQSCARHASRRALRGGVSSNVIKHVPSWLTGQVHRQSRCLGKQSYLARIIEDVGSNVLQFVEQFDTVRNTPASDGVKSRLGPVASTRVGR